MYLNVFRFQGALYICQMIRISMHEIHSADALLKRTGCFALTGHTVFVLWQADEAFIL